MSKRKHWLCVCLFYLLCIYLWLLGRHGSCVQKRIHKNIEEAKILSSSFLKIIVLNLANHIMSISVKRFLIDWPNLKSIFKKFFFLRIFLTELFFFRSYCRSMWVLLQIPTNFCEVRLQSLVKMYRPISRTVSSVLDTFRFHVPTSICVFHVR